MLSKYRVLFTIIVAIIIAVSAVTAIFWARGFKPDFRKGQIDRTGLIVATSVPTGAEIYLDDRLTSATNTSIAFLDPKTYKVKIQKDGYTVWEKEIEIRADLATEIKALLFPLAPEIKPLTNTGASNPTLSPDGSKIAYGVSGERGGLYTVAMAERGLPFRQDTRLVAKNQANFDFSKAKFVWGPDSKQLIARFENTDGRATANLLADTDKSDDALRDITGSLNSTLSAWQDELNLKAQNQSFSAPDSVKESTDSAQTKPSPSPSPRTGSQPISTLNSQFSPLNYYPTGLIYSPDEEKILFKNKQSFSTNKEGDYKVYDLKTKKEYTMPDFENFISIAWFPDSNHLVVAQNDLISIIEADGTNKMTIYSGKFEDGFVFAHPAGTRMIILTKLTQPEGNPPNLYSINLR